MGCIGRLWGVSGCLFRRLGGLSAVLGVFSAPTFSHGKSFAIDKGEAATKCVSLGLKFGLAANRGAFVKGISP